MIVPNTAFVERDDQRATPSVSFSAATASGCVTTDQNAATPFARDAQMSAAIGSTTMTERNGS